MRLYVDTSVLIVYLYGEATEPERFAHTAALFDRFATGEITAVFSLYTLQELHGYIRRVSPPEDVDEAFRTSVLELFSYPAIIAPYLDRLTLKRYRRKLNVRDATDVPHIVIALERQCDGIVAYDERFRDVAEVLAYYRPPDLL